MPDPVLYSGTSGKIIITSASNAELAVGTYTFEKTAQLADIGNSTSGGFEKAKRIRRGGRLTATVLWDSGAVPETLNIDSGDEFAANLYIGDSGKMYPAVPLISESLAVVGCTQDNVVTYALTARTNGTIPDPAATP